MEQQYRVSYLRSMTSYGHDPQFRQTVAFQFIGLIVQFQLYKYQDAETMKITIGNDLVKENTKDNNLAMDKTSCECQVRSLLSSTTNLAFGSLITNNDFICKLFSKATCHDFF